MELAYLSEEFADKAEPQTKAPTAVTGASLCLHISLVIDVCKSFLDCCVRSEEGTDQRVFRVANTLEEKELMTRRHQLLEMIQTESHRLSTASSTVSVASTRSKPLVWKRVWTPMMRFIEKSQAFETLFRESFST